MINRLVGFALASVAITAVLAPNLHTAEMPGGDAKGNFAVSVGHSSASSQDDGNAMVLRRDGSGQFHLTASVDNQDVAFLVDTGADVVALTEETARQINRLPAETEFQPVMKTASGTGYGAPVILDTVEIGGERFHNVEAVVMKGLETNLMGQTVLRRLGKVELQGDSMVIRPS
ncbi:MAG: TIGR02281 family clan AA aspartic protease [Proteobacteria bacterium]|nr:TIGR02281 family clan AA aspartic protease [Pseudomonadota bacterium]MDE2412923.1 TIGR02281 family clan AA aspartic protease [Sphingomonadales bacterium]